MMKRVWIIGLVLGVFLIHFLSAVTCNPSFVSVNFAEGSSFQSSTQCTNSGNTSVSISTSGEISFFSITESTISQSGIKTILIDFSSSIPPGSHSGFLTFGDGSSTPIAFFVESTSNIDSQILVFPTSKVTSISQGTQKTQNILITVPSDYGKTITIQSVDLNPTVETISFGDLNLGQVAPGQTIQIPIIFSGVDASPGTYQTTLDIFAIDSSGQVNLPKVSLQLQVNTGINPSIDFSLSDVPTCSLSATEFNLNQTYTFTCSRNNPNYVIQPKIDTFYLKGLSVTETSNQYIYNFKAQRLGNTLFRADFIFLNAPVGDPFEQEVRISPSGSSPIPGTTLDFEFYQSGKRTDITELGQEETIIQIIDNETRSLVNSFELYFGGLKINNTINLIYGEEYELRVTSPGYLDRIINFNVSKIPLVITIVPDKSSYKVGETITITTDPENASLLINGIQITSPYTIQTAGDLRLKAVKEGYLPTEINFTTTNGGFYDEVSPLLEDWRKGKDVFINLKEEGTWEVLFFEKLDGGISETSSIIASGTSSRIEFEISDYGRYDVKVGSAIPISKIIEKRRIITLVTDNWLWSVVILLTLLLIGYNVFFKDREEEEGKWGGTPSQEN